MINRLFLYFLFTILLASCHSFKKDMGRAVVISVNEIFPRKEISSIVVKYELSGAEDGEIMLLENEHDIDMIYDNLSLIKEEETFTLVILGGIRFDFISKDNANRKGSIYFYGSDCRVYMSGDSKDYKLAQESTNFLYEMLLMQALRTDAVIPKGY